MKKLLVVIDMQNDFIDGALGTKEAVAIVPNVKKKIEEFQGKVIFTRDTHFESCIVDAVISAKDEIVKFDKEFKLQEEESNQIEQEWWQRYHENKKQGL